jgi:hypothetical protein
MYADWKIEFFQKEGAASNAPTCGFAAAELVLGAPGPATGGEMQKEKLRN